MSKRIHYIDTLKGIAILIVVAHHIPYVSLDLCGIQNCFLENFKYVRNFIYMPFFMVLFFITSGMCTNFEKSFDEFLKKTLYVIIPCYIFCRCSHWFINAYIISRLIYYFINKYVKGDVFKQIICLTLGGGACFFQGNISHHAPYQCFHALLMVWFIFLGHRYKNVLLNVHYEIAACFVYVVTVVLCYVHLHDIPAFESGFHVSIFTYPLFILLAVSGTMMMTMVARILDNKIFRYIGMMSIVVFCVHFDFLKILFQKTGHILNDMSYTGSIFYCLLIFLTTSIFSVVIAKVLDNKYGKCLIGKF